MNIPPDFLTSMRIANAILADIDGLISMFAALSPEAKVRMHDAVLAGIRSHAAVAQRAVAAMGDMAERDPSLQPLLADIVQQIAALPQDLPKH